VDIQEFSRVICSGFLRQRQISADLVQRTLSAAANRAEILRSAMRPLISHEQKCAEEAAAGEFGRLCNVAEQGSVVGFRVLPESVIDRDLVAAIEETISNLARLDLQDSRDSLICRYFGGVYFSYSQAADLDAILTVAAMQDKDDRDLFVAAALSAASSAVNTVGKHFAQPIRPRDSLGNPKKHVIAKILQDRSIDVLLSYAEWLDAYRNVRIAHSGNIALRDDYAAMLASHTDDISAVYADPPYTRDHYSRFYHVLETMCLRDAPGVSITRVRGVDRVSRGLYRLDRHQSPFCIRSQAPKAFAALFAGVAARRVPLVLSYSPDMGYEGSQPRVMTIDSIRGLAVQYFSSVDIDFAAPISHSKLNSTERILGRSIDAERLLICRP
jgi:adenine-specific DNA-methyltransferase